MGFILDVDLETSEGPSHEVYVRIESVTYNKVTNLVQFQLTYWQERKYAIRFNRTYMDEEMRNAEGLIQERVLYFADSDSDGVEVLLPHHIKVPLTSTKEVEVPMYETRQVEKEVPFISFNEEGDEVIKYRTVHSEEKIRTGVTVEYKEVIDTTLLSDLFGFCYNKALETISQWIPEENILIVK